MFGKPKSSPLSSETEIAPARVGNGAMAQLPAARNLQPGDAVSSISSGMTLVGKFMGDGAVNVFGRVDGELHAATIHIFDGAEVDGDVVAQDLTVGGRVKGTIHAARVTLKGTAIVEGDIFHRSLSIEENARFEGSSRREDEFVVARPNLRDAGPPPQVVSLGDSRKLKAAPDEELFHSAD